MNDKQKAIIDQLVQLEYAINGVLGEAFVNGLDVQIEERHYFPTSQLHFRLLPAPLTQTVVPEDGRD